jgi:peptide/nickel transport system substrate-binding protein
LNTIETPDKNTLLLKSDLSRPAIFDLFENLNIVDRESVEGPDAGKKLAGTGPFVFVDWKQGVSARYVKNKNYWQIGKPYADEMLVTFVGDQQGLLLQLEAGAFDVIDKPSIPDLVRLSKDPKYTIVRNEVAGASYAMGFNVKLPPTDNKKLRQAISYATDRKRFVDSVFQGFSSPQVLPWPAHSPAYDAAKNSSFTYDLDKARKLVDESGLKGAEVDIIYNADGVASQFAALSQIMQADAAKIGLKLNVKPMGNAAWSAASKDLAFPFVNLVTTSFANLEPSTNFLLSSYWSPAVNSEGFKSERYEQLLDQVGSEPDAAKRKALYDQLNDFLLDECFLVAIAQDPRAAITRSNIRGLLYTQAPQLTAYGDVWIAG